VSHSPDAFPACAAEKISVNLLFTAEPEPATTTPQTPHPGDKAGGKGGMGSARTNCANMEVTPRSFRRDSFRRVYSYRGYSLAVAPLLKIFSILFTQVESSQIGSSHSRCSDHRGTSSDTIRPWQIDPDAGCGSKDKPPMIPMQTSIATVMNAASASEYPTKPTKKRNMPRMVLSGKVPDH